MSAGRRGGVTIASCCCEVIIGVGASVVCKSGRRREGVRAMSPVLSDACWGEMVMEASLVDCLVLEMLAFIQRG